MEEKISTPITDEFLDGGDVKTPASPEVKVEDYDSKNRGVLAQFLIAILAGLFFMHYTLLFVLEWNGKKDPKTLEAAFNASLPIISGLVASAVTYYFTRGDKNSGS